MKLYYYQHDPTSEVWVSSEPPTEDMFKASIDMITKKRFCQVKREELDYIRNQNKENSAKR